ncbi:unnamed protein product [Fusarium venenatum]|uniref:Uncharacterized protein n=1 Tax=Fusarium venenatum TaxID=56646 RepID=A0A2L2TTK5_9HYPO|nr:uncharacterized protein FVRRES_03868 [Fusarium venenatum]CEI67356.1 unnamed protein product [Fusarium venenatum]
MLVRHTHVRYGHLRRHLQPAKDEETFDRQLDLLFVVACLGSSIVVIAVQEVASPSQEDIRVVCQLDPSDYPSSSDIGFLSLWELLIINPVAIEHFGIEAEG